ncbi:MAG: glycosyltransferase family 4 protein [Deltaproteobacteria bacterium]|nr:glycosyltransferase family 4 protein [Deltaproteobacteria bacterium]
MIRILHIHTLPIISGSGLNTFLTMEGMDKSRYEVHLACAPGGPLIDLVEGNGMKVTTFRNLVQPVDPLRDSRVTMEIWSFLRKNPFHVVHTHNSKAGFVGRLAAKLAGTCAVIHTVHGFAFHREEPFWRRTLFRNLERLAAHWCDRMIFISQPLIDWAIGEKIYTKDKIVKIYSGIDLDRFHPVSEEEQRRHRRKLNLGPQDAVIGIVSKLWEGKGHNVLITAFKKISQEVENARLVIVGEGYLLDELTCQVKDLGLEEFVVFTGFVEDVPGIISTFDVAVLPSFFEGMGRVLLEAMAMEKPVVASRVGGIPDLVDDGKNGFLVNPRDPDALAGSIVKLLKDRALAGSMGKAGLEKICDKYSAKQMVRAIEGVYREILNKKGVNLED